MEIKGRNHTFNAERNDVLRDIKAGTLAGVFTHKKIKQCSE